MFTWRDFFYSKSIPPKHFAESGEAAPESSITSSFRLFPIPSLLVSRSLPFECLCEKTRFVGTTIAETRRTGQQQAKNNLNLLDEWQINITKRMKPHSSS
jgi:hypothetical protein